MLLKRVTLSIALVLVSMGLFSSCSVTLNGASIPPEMKTINVQYFENTAPLVVNNLSQLFTEAIKSRIRSQTRLAIVSGEADATLSGAITGYSIAPVSVQATQGNQAPIASASRLTITVNVKYVNEKDSKQNYEQSFSRYTDFRGSLGAQEQQLIQTINQQLTEDIFNKAFANW
ncbi:LptE family protein [Mucilaginibacter lacusdianchii]|uniref:LptE family protein n=1 Tax=Mucilaginibacter lacusdianchii TaxID=2684211 RepID=UPI00131E386D|nr:LptE family protein [Mucilaginibacter sp. JXJ CY 39]